MIPFQRSLFADDDVDHALVIYHVMQCPVRWCRSDQVYVVHTDGRRRTHKCHACGYFFKSVQQELINPDMARPEEANH